MCIVLGAFCAGDGTVKEHELIETRKKEEAKFCMAKPSISCDRCRGKLISYYIHYGLSDIQYL